MFVEIIAQAYGALDAFILISDDSTFAPRAQAKPDQLFNQTLSNYFPFQGRIDSFSSTTPTDMSFLNEDVAGAGGRIIVQGDSFVQSNTGKKIKFWAVNMGDAHLDTGSIVQMVYGANLCSKCFIFSFPNSYIQCRQSNLKRWASI